jgi:YD repeat-containing protein
MRCWGTVYNFYLTCAVAGVLSLYSGPALAQNAGANINSVRPPDVPLVDENGVNLQTGVVEHESMAVTIGTDDAKLEHRLISRDGVFSVNGALSDVWMGGIDDGPVWDFIRRESQIIGGNGGGPRGPQVVQSPVVVDILGKVSKFSPGYIDPSNPSVVSHYSQLKDGSFLFSQGLTTSTPGGDGYQNGYNFVSGSRYTYIDRDGNQYTADFVQQAHTANLRPFGGTRKIVYNNGKTITFNYEYKMVVGTGLEGFFGWWRLRSIVSNYGYMLHYKYMDNRPYAQTATINTQMGLAEYIDSVTAIDTNIDNCAPLAQACSFSRVWPSIKYTTTGKVDYFESDSPYYILGTPKPPLTVPPATYMYSNSAEIPTYTLTTTNAAGENNQYLIKRGSGYQSSLGTYCIAYPNVKLTMYPRCMGSIESSGIFNSIMGTSPAPGQSPALKREYTYGYVGSPGGYANNPYAITGSTQEIPLYPYLPNDCPVDALNPYFAGRGVVSSVSAHGRVWKYNYCLGGGLRTIVTNPMGGKRVYDFGQLNGQGTVYLADVLSKLTDENGRVTTFTYEPATLLSVPGWRGYTTPVNPRPASIVYPEGNSDVYTYDARGNITSKTVNPKPGSGLTPIVEFQASFDASCTNYVKCNQPNWTKDAKGNQTDYAYNSRGFIETVIKPADPNGLRPTISYEYQDFPTRDGTSLYLLISTTEKIDAARSRKTAYTYDPNSHWSMKSRLDDVGGLNLLTCYGRDALGNLISETEPNAGLGQCP